MIVARETILKAYERAIALKASHEEAVRTVALATGQDEATVRAVIEDAQTC